MTAEEANTWIKKHIREDPEGNEILDKEELEAAFTALYSRPSKEKDRQRGLWFLCCRALICL